jgi:hypothetical protein
MDPVEKEEKKVAQVEDNGNRIARVDNVRSG